jgi:hypothetical protein
MVVKLCPLAGNPSESRKIKRKAQQCAQALAYGMREQAQAEGLTDTHQGPLTCHFPTPQPCRYAM